MTLAEKQREGDGSLEVGLEHRFIYVFDLVLSRREEDGPL